MNRYFYHKTDFLNIPPLVLLAIFTLSSCDNRLSEEPPAYQEVVDAPAVVHSEASEDVYAYSQAEGESVKAEGSYPVFTQKAAAPVSVENFSEYTVILGVDEEMEIPGFPGELRVWIGNELFDPNLPASMAYAETVMPAVGESARVEPFAPAFDIEPTETQCIKIHASGSEVRFRLTPKRKGRFNVGANVFLFGSADCSGSPIPKTAATLEVNVVVNTAEMIAEKADELGSIFWEKLLEFWGALVALIFAASLFLVRNRLKQWFSFEDK